MSNIQDNSPCPICGKTLYSWGGVHAPSLQFFADDSVSFKKAFRNLMLKKVPARQCNSCGNIQLFSQDFVGEK